MMLGILGAVVEQAGQGVRGGARREAQRGDLEWADGRACRGVL
jgi:hypothetical protein